MKDCRYGLYMGALFSLPVLTMIGAALGGMGGVLARPFPAHADEHSNDYLKDRARS